MIETQEHYSRTMGNFISPKYPVPRPPYLTCCACGAKVRPHMAYVYYGSYSDEERERKRYRCQTCHFQDRRPGAAIKRKHSEEQRAKWRASYHKNVEKRREQRNARYQRNAEQHRAYMRAYYQTHKETLLAQQQDRRAKAKEARPC